MRIGKHIAFHADRMKRLYLIPTIGISLDRCAFSIELNFLVWVISFYYWRNYFVNKEYLKEDEVHSI